MSLDAALARITRHVPRFRGWHRMLEPLRAHYARRYAGRADRWVVIHDFEGGLEMRLDRSAAMASAIYWRGIYSFSEAALVRRLLPSDGVFCDIGANQGELTLVAARRAPRGRVYAFEPVPEWFALLEENVCRNSLAQVRAVHAALSDAEGAQEMYAVTAAAGSGAARDGGNEGLSSFHAAPGATRLGAFPVTTLDAFAAREALPRLDVIKIDVEGAEERVLAGGAATLARFRPALVLEWNPGALVAQGGSGASLLATLRGLGYALAEVDPFARERALPRGATPRTDTLLARHAPGL